MKEIIRFIFSQDACLQEVGLTVIRIGVGLVYMRHGLPKIFNYGELLWHGQQMANLGITFAPLMWGIAAAYSEFLGGFALVLGLGTRFFAPFMAFTMFVAVIHHIVKGDSYGFISHPLVMMIVFIGLTLAGSGRYSLDAWFMSR